MVDAGATKITEKDLVRELIDKTVDVPVMLQRRKIVEVPQVQYVDEIVDVPIMTQRQVPTIQNCAEYGGSATSSIS